MLLVNAQASAYLWPWFGLDSAGLANVVACFTCTALQSDLHWTLHVAVHFLHRKTYANNMILEILKHDKIRETISPTPNSGGRDPLPLLFTPLTNTARITQQKYISNLQRCR